MKFELGKYPIEIFGHTYTDNSEIAINHRETQFCPYLNRECTKPRKSEPHIKVGICSLGYKSSFLNRCEPVIICPFRFLEDIVFDSIHEKFFPNWNNVKWVKEVDMGVSGNVDYVALKMNESGTAATDFFCVEFQANGTTGSPYPYVKDLLQHGEYSTSYTYGLNWANEFMKTMMQQVYKKGQVVNSWNRKIVFVIQDVALFYLESAVDTSGLRNDISDPVHFMTYKMVLNEEKNEYNLAFYKWVSADLECINKILAGANPEQYLTEDDFLKKAVRKGKEDGIFNGN